MLLDAEDGTTTASELADDLMDSLEQRAEAVYRYGVGMDGDDEGNAGGRFLLVVDRVDLDALRLAGRASVRARKAGYRVRIDTAHDLLHATDTHPVFTLTLMDTRELLAGSDVLAGIAIERTDLRLRVEQSLRSMVHELTDEYLFAPRNEMRIERLLRRSGHRLIYLLAGLALVKGLIEPPSRPGGLGGAGNIIEAATPLMDADGKATLDALRRYARRELNPSGDDLQALLGRVLTLLQSLVRHADAAGAAPSL